MGVLDGQFMANFSPGIGIHAKGLGLLEPESNWDASLFLYWARLHRNGVVGNLAEAGIVGGGFNVQVMKYVNLGWRWYDDQTTQTPLSYDRLQTTNLRYHMGTVEYRFNVEEFFKEKARPGRHS